MKQKKTILLLIWLASLTTAMSQELIGLAGGGLMKSPEIQGDYEFVEARMMFGLAPSFRLGPSGQAAWFYWNQADNFSRGHNFSAGLSIDGWNRETRLLSHYFWLNGWYRWSKDQGANADGYESWQEDRLISLSGGLKFTNILDSWFGDHLLMAEYQCPLKPGKKVAYYRDLPVLYSPPYDKERVRIVYENGIKHVPFLMGNKELHFSPLIHFGYDWTAGDNRSAYEIGTGIYFGWYRDWYHDLFKVKAFYRGDLGTFEPGKSEAGAPAYFQVEVTLNLLNLKFNQKKSHTK